MSALVGILNITPDSFSDGGRYLAPDAACAQCEALVAAGADMIDVGAESTRPGAVSPSPEEEWARLSPVLAVLPRHVPISIDTRNAQTAARALDAGVSLINDQSGLEVDAMCALLAQAECSIVVMHQLGLPVDPARVWGDAVEPVAEILRWKAAVTARAEAAGIAPERLIYDPGIGFGKTPLQSLALMRRAPELVASGGRWYYGHSRKSFLKLFTDAPPEGRDAWTLSFSQWLVRAGVHYLRVHDVARHKAALCM